MIGISTSTLIALVHPDFYDPTDHLTKTQCVIMAWTWLGIVGSMMTTSVVMAVILGVAIGLPLEVIGASTCGSPLDDLTPKQAVANISSTVNELTSGVITPDHLIDDYTLVAEHRQIRAAFHHD